MNLGKNVYNLLKRQPEVYVDGLGSFRRNHTPATYDEKRNVYLPPITYIDFDRTSTAGYDFIQYMQQLHLIDRREAADQVQTQVTELLNRIAEDGQAKLDDLGHLVSYGDSYIFKALDLSGFGLEPVEAIAGQPVVATNTAPEEITSTEAVEPPPEVEEKLVAEEEIAAFEEEPVAVGRAEVFEEAESRPRSNTLWYVLLAVVALGVIGALYWTNRGPSATPGERTTLADNGNQPDSSQQIRAADSLKQDTVAVKEPLVPENHTWQIVIGSHRTLAQAYEQAESYNKAGFDRVRVIPSNLARNRKKVIWDSYETKVELDSALQYVRKHHIPDAWPDKIK